jgi:GNAT superfamily N-acetyltransferase
VRESQWDDLARLFGERGACGGCWCQVWRLSHKDFESGKGAANLRRLKRLIDRGAEPGILAYAGDEAVGWIALAPREDYPALARSRVLAPVDDRSVWSVSCLYVRKDQRKRGVSVALLRNALEFVRARGGGIVEGYPVEPRPGKGHLAAAFAWTGLASAFLAAGFREVARRSETRPIMRKTVRGRPTGSRESDSSAKS